MRKVPGAGASSRGGAFAARQDVGAPGAFTGAPAGGVVVAAQEPGTRPPWNPKTTSGVWPESRRDEWKAFQKLLSQMVLTLIHII